LFYNIVGVIYYVVVPRWLDSVAGMEVLAVYADQAPGTSGPRRVRRARRAARIGAVVAVLTLGAAWGVRARFGKAAAGKAFASPAWTWGVASERLTAALDPSGVPDAYLLLDAAGRMTYHNSVPVSTMGALLARLPARAAAGG
jgi:hypothetical protein